MVKVRRRFENIDSGPLLNLAGMTLCSQKPYAEVVKEKDYFTSTEPCVMMMNC